MKMFKNFPIIYKTARPAGRTEMRPYKRHIINILTAPQTPNNRISSPLTSYLLPLTSIRIRLRRIRRTRWQWSRLRTTL